MRRFLIPMLPAALLTLAAADAHAASAQSRRCAAQAADQHLTGAEARRFRKTCLSGALAPARPTAPSGASAESRAVVAPSGADRTDRSKQCDAEADKKKLSGQARKEFRLSCVATAGPTNEGETHNRSPAPSKSINGIGINNYGRPPGAPTGEPQPHQP